MAFLEMKHISKYFGDVAANVDVNLSVEKGEVHALLGENGAGKSTLMNILYGMYSQSEGEIYLNGELVHIKDPKDSIAKGIGMVHQHFMLIPALSVIENVVLGLQGQKFVLDLKTAAKEFSELAKKYGMEIDPWAKVSQLSVGQQQRLEILKALYRKADLLILDEPTAVLTPQEVEGLFEMIRGLTKEGHTIIFISHKLVEIMEICDRCTVLRQGRVVKTTKISEIHDRKELAALMVGHQVDMTIEKKDIPRGDKILDVKDLSFVNKKKVQVLKNISFDVYGGEILGICGVDGNGQSELVHCLTGLETATSGQFMIKGKDMTHSKPRDILSMGVSHIPEDRLKYGMVREMNVNENLLLMTYRKPEYNKHGLFDWKKITAKNEQLCETYNVKTPSVSELAGNLSGGNQQKVVVAREMEREPDLLIAVHPDRGLDIGATKYIQNRIVEARDRGTAVLLVSTELEEIMELSDRILVIYEGQVMDILPQKEATRHQLGLLMAGVHQKN